MIGKLKCVLDIDDNESAHWQLQKFFLEKFKRPETPEYGGHNPPDKPDLEMLSREVFGHMQDAESKKQEASQEAHRIKEQMLGYVNGIIARQDEHNILKTTETYQIETATRKAMKELVNFY